MKYIIESRSAGGQWTPEPDERTIVALFDDRDEAVEAADALLGEDGRDEVRVVERSE